MNVRYSAKALSDVDEIFAYIYDRSPQGAHAVAAAIEATISRLSMFPHSAPETDEPGVRMTPVGRSVSDLLQRRGRRTPHSPRYTWGSEASVERPVTPYATSPTHRPQRDLRPISRERRPACGRRKRGPERDHRRPDQGCDDGAAPDQNCDGGTHEYEQAAARPLA